MQAMALPATQVAEWIAAVIVNLDLFGDVGFYNDTDEMPRVIYKYVVATQSPRRAIFLECRCRDHASLPSSRCGQARCQILLGGTISKTPCR